MKSLPIVAWSLGLGGVIPFALLTFIIAGSVELSNMGITTATSMLTTYAAIIISFIGAIHWGVALPSETLDLTSTNRLYAYSIIPSLLAWFTLLLPDRIALLSLAILVAGTWFVDRLLLFRRVTLSNSRLRTILTVLVSSLLILAAISV